MAAVTEYQTETAGVVARQDLDGRTWYIHRRESGAYLGSIRLAENGWDAMPVLNGDIPAKTFNMFQAGVEFLARVDNKRSNPPGPVFLRENIETGEPVNAITLAEAGALVHELRASGMYGTCQVCVLGWDESGTLKLACVDCFRSADPGFDPLPDARLVGVN